MTSDTRRRSRAVRAPAGRIRLDMSGAPFVIETVDSVSSMFMGGGSAQVGGGEKREDVRLQQRREDAQRHHRPRHDVRNEALKNAAGLVLSKDVPVETHGKRKSAREVADHLDQEHERRQHQHRAEEVLEVAEEPVRPDPGGVEEEEARDRERERDVQVRRRRLQEEEEPRAEEEDDDRHGDVVRNPAEQLTVLSAGRDPADMKAAKRDSVAPPGRRALDGAEEAGQEGVEEPEEYRMLVVHVVPALTGPRPSRSGARSGARGARRSPPRRPPSRGPRQPTGRRPAAPALSPTGRD